METGKKETQMTQWTENSGRLFALTVSSEGASRAKAKDSIDVLLGKELDNDATEVRALIKNPAMNGGVCCFGKEFDSEFNTFLTALKLPCVASSWVLNPSHTINVVHRNKLVSAKAVGKSIANGFSANQHFAVVAHIDSAWKHASLAETRADRNGDPNIATIRRFVVPVLLDGKPESAFITVKESVKHGNRIYSLELKQRPAVNQPRHRVARVGCYGKEFDSGYVPLAYNRQR